MNRSSVLRSSRGLPRLDIVRLTLLAVPALVLASWLYILIAERASVGDVLSGRALTDAWEFLERLLGLREGPETPAFLRASRWVDALDLAYDTLAMSVLAIGLVTIGVLLTVVPAARTSVSGAGGRPALLFRALVFFVVRALYVFSRAVPELVWAMVIIFVLRPGILAGAVALAIHNFGIVGKLAAEVVEDLDPALGRALRVSGASGPQALLYGMLPQVLPQFLTFVLYRWEVIMRTTIVVGFVAAGGLGREFQLRMSFFQLTDVALILFVYFLLVVAGDAASAVLRRMAR